MVESPVVKIKEEELKNYRGKRVDTRQLEDILDTYIILTNAETVNNPTGPCYVAGILDDFSKEKIFITKRNSTRIFNDSLEREEFVNFEY